MIVTIVLSNRDVTLELPFTLSHPKPAEETPPPTPVQSAPSEEAAQGVQSGHLGGDVNSLTGGCKRTKGNELFIFSFVEYNIFADVRV